MILLGILGGQEIILIIIAILILFGGKKIPELMRGIGKGINEFTKAKDGIYDNEDKKVNEEPKNDIKK
ncbi:MAG: twin-arginine translocase TatA/TatE family subunit [Bacteroidetes bacterium]|nr:twin-arginine translocase TatA/TatE family subunit [Bacteroidota bacterium]